MSASAVWYYFNKVMQEAIRRFVPHRAVTTKSKNLLWMTRKVLRSVKKKTYGKLGQKCNDSSDDNLKVKYKKQVNKANKAVRLTKRDFERQIAKNIKKDSKKTFFEYARSKIRVKSTIGLVGSGAVRIGPTPFPDRR